MLTEKSNFETETVAGLLAGDLDLRRMREPADPLVVVLCLNELESIARLIAVTSSTANALETSRRSGVAEVCLETFLPPAPSVILATVQAQYAAELALETLTSLQTFAARLEAAKRMTRAFIEHPAEIKVKGGIHIATIAECWRALASDAVLLRAKLRSELSITTRETVLPADSRLTRLLALVGSGATPCLREDGTVEIPGWAERRATRRYTVSWPALLDLNGTLEDVTIVDFSTGGAGVRVERELVPGSTVHLSVSARERFEARVRWCRAGRAGLLFMQSLDTDDPVLQRAREEAQAVLRT